MERFIKRIKTSEYINDVVTNVYYGSVPADNNKQAIERVAARLRREYNVWKPKEQLIVDAGCVNDAIRIFSEHGLTVTKKGVTEGRCFVGEISLKKIIDWKKELGL